MPYTISSMTVKTGDIFHNDVLTLEVSKALKVERYRVRSTVL